MKENKPVAPVSSVTVTPCPKGVNMPISSLAVTMTDCFNQPPQAEIIGEAVTHVIESMWKRGHDPAHPDFVLLVTFK